MSVESGDTIIASSQGTVGTFTNNPCVTIEAPKIDTKHQNLFEIINAYQHAESVNTRVKKAIEGEYNRLYGIAQGCDNENEFLDSCNIGEDLWFKENYGPPDILCEAWDKKKRRWKARTYLPKSYSSAKSVLSKALRAGVMPNASIVGKTALERAYKAQQAKAHTHTLAPVDPNLKHLQELEETIKQLHILQTLLKDLIDNPPIFNINGPVTPEDFKATVRAIEDYAIDIKTLAGDYRSGTL